LIVLGALFSLQKRPAKRNNNGKAKKAELADKSRKKACLKQETIEKKPSLFTRSK
jgi:hypothetical protein